MPRSKDSTPQVSLFDDGSFADYVTHGVRPTPPRLARAEQLARLIVADVEKIRALVRELHTHVPQQEDDA